MTAQDLEVREGRPDRGQGTMRTFRNLGLAGVVR